MEHLNAMLLLFVVVKAMQYRYICIQIITQNRIIMQLQEHDPFYLQKYILKT